MGGKQRREARERSWRRHHEEKCRGKKSYHSAQNAKNAAFYSTLNHRIDFHVYKCPVCHLWHLTKTDQQKFTGHGFINSIWESRDRGLLTTDEALEAIAQFKAAL